MHFVNMYSPDRKSKGGGVNFQNFDFLPAFSIHYFETFWNAFPYGSNSFKFMQILGKFELFRPNYSGPPCHCKIMIYLFQTVAV